MSLVTCHTFPIRNRRYLPALIAARIELMSAAFFFRAASGPWALTRKNCFRSKLKLAESGLGELEALLGLAAVALGLTEVLESPPALVSSGGDFSSSWARTAVVRASRDKARIAVMETRFFFMAEGRDSRGWED